MDKSWGGKIWESQCEKLLGLIVDKKLNFDLHLRTLCKKVNQKVSALARIVRILPFRISVFLLSLGLDVLFKHIE